MLCHPSPRTTSPAWLRTTTRAPGVNGVRPGLHLHHDIELGLQELLLCELCSALVHRPRALLLYVHGRGQLRVEGTGLLAGLPVLFQVRTIPSPLSSELHLAGHGVSQAVGTWSAKLSSVWSVGRGGGWAQRQLPYRPQCGPRVHRNDRLLAKRWCCPGRAGQGCRGPHGIC